MLKVLVVDDSLIMRRNMSKTLEGLGHAVVAEAKNGREAIEQYARVKPDLVTMDITMPDMDGIAAVKGIRRIDPCAKIIMVTSHGQEDMVIGAIRYGASGYLLKPLSAVKLGESIRKVCPTVAAESSSDQSESEYLEGDEIIFPEIEDIL